jgi:hypothetical protein
MKKFLGLFILVIIITIGCKADSHIGTQLTSTPMPLPTVSEEELFIYSVVIPEIEWFKEGPALIEAQTCSTGINLGEDASYIKRELPKLQDATFADFTTQLQINGNIQEGYFQFDHAVFSMEDFTEPNGNQEFFSWELFREAHPQGSLICVSRVGFNNDHSQAFLYATSGFASLAARGYYVFLTYSKGIWTIEKLVFAWGA